MPLYSGESRASLTEVQVPMKTCFGKLEVMRLESDAMGTSATLGCREDVHGFPPFPFGGRLWMQLGAWKTSVGGQQMLLAFLGLTPLGSLSTASSC